MSDVDIIATEGVPVILPADVFAVLKSFAVDNLSGNVQMNFQNGRLLGLRVEQVIRLKPGR